MRLRRRTFLATGTATLATLSGCSNPLSSGATLGLELFNYTDDSQRLRLRFLREDRDDHGGAEVIDREFEVPAPADGESAGTVSESDVATQRRYVVRVQLRDGRATWNHHHYYPPGHEPVNVIVA